MNFHLMAWKICGLWHRPKQPRWYFYYAVFVSTIIYIIFPINVAFQLLYATSLKQMIEILLILPTAMVGVKAVLIIINQPKLLNIFDILEQMDVSVQTKEHENIVKEQLKGSRILLGLLSMEYCMSVSANILLALFAQERIFMWAQRTWYPFDYQHNLAIYYGLLFYQFVSSSFIAFTSLSMDVYGLALYKLLGAHIDILGLKLNMIGKSDNKDNSNKLVRPKQWFKDCEQELTQCINYHNLCIKYTGNYFIYCI